MKHKIRLGPIAVFLAVVTVVLTMLAILSISTANADYVLAKRFARVTQIRYELEADGERFLQSFDEQAKSGSLSEGAIGAERTEAGNIAYSEEKEGYVLEIEVSEPGPDGKYDIRKWKIKKIWNTEDPFGDLWMGGKQ